MPSVVPTQHPAEAPAGQCSRGPTIAEPIALSAVDAHAAYSQTFDCVRGAYGLDTTYQRVHPSNFHLGPHSPMLNGVPQAPINDGRAHVDALKGATAVGDLGKWCNDQRPGTLQWQGTATPLQADVLAKDPIGDLCAPPPSLNRFS